MRSPLPRSLLVPGICHETACSGQRDKGAPGAGRKEQFEQELIWELDRRAGAVPGGDTQVSAARRCCGNSQTVPLPTRTKRCSPGAWLGSGTPPGTRLCPAPAWGCTGDSGAVRPRDCIREQPSSEKCSLSPPSRLRAELCGAVWGSGFTEGAGSGWGGGNVPWEVSCEWEGALGGVQTNVLLKAGSALRSHQSLGLPRACTGKPAGLEPSRLLDNLQPQQCPCEG